MNITSIASETESIETSEHMYEHKWHHRLEQYRLLRSLLSTVNHAPVLVIGPTTTGKTSVCKDILNLTQTPYAFVDCKTYSNERAVMECIGVQWKQWLDGQQAQQLEPTTTQNLFSPVSGEDTAASSSSVSGSTTQAVPRKPFDIHKFISNGYESLENVTLFPSAFIVLKHAHILHSLSKLVSILSSTLLSTLSMSSLSSTFRYAQIGLVVIEHQVSVHENAPLSLALNACGRSPIVIHFPTYNSASISDILVTQLRASIPTAVSNLLTDTQYTYLLQALIDVLSHLTHNLSVLFNALRRLLNEPSCCETVSRAKSIRNSSREKHADFDQMEDSVDDIDKDLIATIMHILQPVIRKLYENLQYLDKQFSFHSTSRGFHLPNGINSTHSSKLHNSSSYKVLPFSPKISQKSASNVWSALPLSARFLLLAAYICGFNPSATDLIIFTQNMKRRKRRRATTTSSSANDTGIPNESALENQNMNKLGGSLQSFPLERLLAILDFIWETKSNRCEIYVQIASLTSLHFLQRSSGRAQTAGHAAKKSNVPDTPGLNTSTSARSTRSDTLNDIRFICTISLDVALEVAKSCDVNLKAYLHEVVT